ncbi:MAG: hypothetical protein U9Q38_08665, partial [Thermodesulfobacteriota bacterium]|nr:hypothetical protein [Thermodesulfobacteriota bacterium]
IIVPFNSIPFQIYGESNADLISDNQKVKTAITRGIIDNMAQSNNGQIGVRKGSLDVSNRKKMFDGKNFEFNGNPSDVWQGSYNQIPGSAFNMLAMMNNEIESMTGVKSFSGGINSSSLGATATGAKGAMDATSTRRMNTVRNISENLLKPLMRKWMAYNSEFLEEDEVVRITNDEFVDIKRDDLDGRIDIDISVSTAEDNSAKAEQLSFLLQTLGGHDDPQVRRDLMSDIYELMRMPDKAKKLREYQPQPDPLEVQMKQIQLQRAQLENEKLKADIQAQYASAGEDEADQRAKLAKAMLDEAKIRNLNSKSDREDLEFLKIDEEIDKLDRQEEMLLKHESEMQKEEHKRMTNLEVIAAQARMNDRNIGIIQ